MSIIPANQIKCGASREDIVNAFCENLMKTIQEKAREGKHDCCFHAIAYCHKESGMVYGQRQEGWKNSDYEFKYAFCDYEDEVREKFRAAGYIVRPTGYIGGVWQQTEDICW